MKKPLTVSIPHQIGRAEARRRLETGVSKLRAEFGGKLGAVEETWTGDRMDFKATALGQSVDGFLTVQEDAVLLEVNLPWIFSVVAEKARGLIRSRAGLLLEKR